jgi:hypothetical protein
MARLAHAEGKQVEKQRHQGGFKEYVLACFHSLCFFCGVKTPSMSFTFVTGAGLSSVV